MAISSGELLELYTLCLPDSRIELLSKRLLLGSSASAGRTMLGILLASLGAEAAVALADTAHWRSALDDDGEGGGDGFREATLRLEADRALTSVMPTASVRGDLISSFYNCPGELLGRDFVMRLGEDAFTPDLIYLERVTASSRLYQSHLEGPAEIVIEFCNPRNEQFLKGVKKERYAAGGVREYWLVNASERCVDFFRLHENGFQPLLPNADGWYGPVGPDELRFNPEALWDGEPAVRTAQSSPRPRAAEARPSGYGWATLPFQPRVGLDTEPITFAEFMAWAPESKFEWYDGRPQIGGRLGTRNVLGLLLMTLGLREATALLPKRDWLEALAKREAEIAEDHHRRIAWMRVAQRGAALMREEFGVVSVFLAGDLTGDEPLHFWSTITLVTWERIAPLDRPRLARRLDGVSGGLDIVVLDVTDMRAAGALESREVYLAL